MQAIARANRVYPGKDFGLIVDYNGMLKSLREALAQYALGDDAGGSGEIVAPIEERVAALDDALLVTEAHLLSLGFDPATLIGATGFTRIKRLADAADVVYTNDESKRRYEILARVVFSRFKALLVEPAAWAFAERHDNLEAIYKKLSERRDTADVSELLKVLHRIVNQAIATQGAGADQATGLTVDLSHIDMQALRDEFAKKVKHKATAIEDIRDIMEKQLAQMLAHNPLRMNYEKKYQEIIAAYNQDKDRATVEDTFARLAELAQGLDAEQQRHVQEGLSEEQLALFDLLQREDLSKADRERVKQASRDLLADVTHVIASLEQWTEKAQTQAEVETFILDRVYRQLPEPAYCADQKQELASRVYHHVWQLGVREQLASRSAR
jgi:type I restriction enzyme R subunit